jgi:hypothetical protein
MSKNYKSHHSHDLDNARRHVGEGMIWLENATESMKHEDWLSAVELLRLIRDEVAPKLAELRDNASARLDEFRKLEDFPAMHTGQIPYPDERAPKQEPLLEPEAEPKPPELVDVPILNAPNAHVGRLLVELHGGAIDEALMAYEPGTPQWNDIQAYVYLSTKKRPQNWIPPWVHLDEEGRHIIDPEDLLEPPEAEF